MVEINRVPAVAFSDIEWSQSCLPHKNMTENIPNTSSQSPLNDLCMVVTKVVSLVKMAKICQSPLNVRCRATDLMPRNGCPVK